MKILITDGYKKAAFLLNQMCCSEHEITFLHDDQTFAEKMLLKHDIEVYIGDTSNPELLQQLENTEFDVLICLSNDDAKNYVICRMVREYLDVKKRITMISNPNNQFSFRQLGIEGTVSASHLITGIINKLATIDDAINYISIHDDSEVRPYEQKIAQNSKVIGKKLKDLVFPDSCIVCCIIRGKKNIIPNGDDMIFAEDRVVIFTNVLDDREIAKVFV